MPDLTQRPLLGNRWVVGARPKTLPAAIVPVLVGTGVAQHFGHFIWWRALMALFVSLALQVGVNYANDYSDGIRGTDEKRTGPVRLVGQGLASPKSVKRAALASFAAAAIAGLVLCAVASWWLILLGVASIVAAWFYTGGKHPYGYKGLGEISVFLFFGLAAVMGSAFVQTEKVYVLSLVAAIPVGFLAMALLVVNNLRDRENDKVSGKITMAVRLGDKNTRWLYAVCVYAPFAFALIAGARAKWVLLVAAAIPLAIAADKPVQSGAKGRDLVAVLQATGKLQLAFGILFAFGLAV